MQTLFKLDAENQALKEEFNEYVEMVEEKEKLDKALLFIDDLRNENKNIRLYCIKHLNISAEMLGETRTEEELIPLLIHQIMNKEEGVDQLKAI